ncbi:protein of unknown function [Paraburkholderia kururiensis]
MVGRHAALIDPRHRRLGRAVARFVVQSEIAVHANDADDAFAAVRRGNHGRSGIAPVCSSRGARWITKAP